MAVLKIFGVTPKGKEIEFHKIAQAEYRSDRFTPADSFVFRVLEVSNETITRVKAELDGQTLFEGIVDTQKQYWGKDGIYSEYDCRSLFAMLLDNEVKPYLYLNLTADEMLRIHGIPFGIKGGNFPFHTSLPQIIARKGESHWEFICKFCRLAYGKTPYIDGKGFLSLTPFSNQIHILDGQKYPIVTAKMIEDRYRMISKLYIKTAEDDYGGVYHKTIENKIATGLGVVRERYYHPGEDWKENSLTSGKDMIRERQLDYFEIDLTFPGLHRFIVGEQAQVKLDNKDFSNLYLAQVKLHSAEDGVTTQVVLWDKTALSWE